ncbi:bifunctional 2-polyprenyl-6-hydroxyphenol methylase/3-demethylubiquinol 3-O-methyltransferase UbiG [Paenibacillus sp. XY044]|uniref:class I SAM-dependent methyltransferase n=1 Tax=Paenibacillus sp. XY044 TaxID=2026089 RepID=UPI000B98CCDC|nr:class I SAM-dependent methyltransferase [Paenibacillus sp. XY044]OZB94259.1 hypothetical protein CJP46_18815 [Paenibacillus sp. XY044]
MFESIYDQQNRWGKDDTFFMRIIERIKPHRIADLGCGTGRLTLHMAGKGYDVTGLDPDEASIRIAKQKDTGNSVLWVIGTSENLEPDRFNVVMMTSNVAQVFVTDAEWTATLHNIFQSLRPGGYLLFDTRNPLARAWERWTKEHSLSEVVDPATKANIRTWHETTSVHLPLVTYDTFYQNLDTREVQSEDDTLIFRERETLRQDLLAAGFQQVNIYGDWEFQQAGLDAKSFICAAKK